MSYTIQCKKTDCRLCNLHYILTSLIPFAFQNLSVFLKTACHPSTLRRGYHKKTKNDYQIGFVPMVFLLLLPLKAVTCLCFANTSRGEPIADILGQHMEDDTSPSLSLQGRGNVVQTDTEFQSLRDVIA